MERPKPFRHAVRVPLLLSVCLSLTPTEIPPLPEMSPSIGYNGKPKKFESTVVNPRRRANRFAGIKNLHQL